MSSIRWGGLVVLVAGIVLVIVAAAIGPGTAYGPDQTAYRGASPGTTAAEAWLWVLGIIGIIVGALMLIFGRGRELAPPTDTTLPPTTGGGL